VSLYPVATSAVPEQVALDAAVRAADEAAPPGTALLILGSALSWHQPLWAPLWTSRPLYYDNWLWYWHPRHVGTPGYVPRAGHHYPDPAQTLTPEYLGRHGIGGVVVTGPVREAAMTSPLLRQVHKGAYDAYLVAAPTTTVTFGSQNAESSIFTNERIDAAVEAPGEPVIARVNWHPRWEATSDSGNAAEILARPDGYLEVTTQQRPSRVSLVYAVQPLDWLARSLAVAGLIGASLLGWRSLRRRG
jgi:hypothetical protein